MSSRSPYSHLLSPGRIAAIELRNRIVLAPMGSFLGGEDGHITERHKRFYEARARGGAGLITTEVVAVDYPRGAAMTRLCCWFPAMMSVIPRGGPASALF